MRKDSSKRILLSVPHMGGREMAYVKSAFDSNWLSTVGPNLQALEREFSHRFGVSNVALGSGTAGLHLGLKLLGVREGDEVLSPTLTFAASCNPILYERAVPVFIDSDYTSWNLDPQLLYDFLRKRARINKLPKVAVVVDLFGQCADWHSIRSICRDFGVLLLEDAAEALGASYGGQWAGTFGDIGVFSFNGNKIITSTGGGMLVSARSEWVEKARFWSTQSRDPDPAGINNYIHSEPGYNYRLSNVLAGIALGQFEVLDERVRQRRVIFARYKEAFADLPGFSPQPEAFLDIHPASNTGSGPSVEHLSETQADLLPYQAPSVQTLHTRWLSCFLVEEKQFGMCAADLIRFLDAYNVEARPVWKPMHTQSLFCHFECIGGDVAEDLNARGICLPSSSSLTEEEQDYVVECVRLAQRNEIRAPRR